MRGCSRERSTLAVGVAMLAVSLCSASSLASPRLLSLQVGSGPGPASLALAAARAQVALGRAREHYTASRFGSCAALMRRVEARLQRALPGPGASADALTTLRRVNLWLGLCADVEGKHAEARAAFARAMGLPGPEPDAELFPPQVMGRYREIEADRRGRSPCERLRAGPTVLAVGGRPLASGPRVAPGEHYLVWRAGATVRSSRGRVDAACRVELPSGPSPVAAAGRLTRAEASDPTLLRRVAALAGVERLLLVDAGGDSIGLSVFDARSGRIVERRESVVRAGQPLLAGMMPALRDDRPRGVRASPAAGEPPWYRRWWVWTLIGAAAAAAVTIPLVATRTTRYEVTF